MLSLNALRLEIRKPFLNFSVVIFWNCLHRIGQLNPLQKVLYHFVEVHSSMIASEEEKGVFPVLLLAEFWLSTSILLLGK